MPARDRKLWNSAELIVAALQAAQRDAVLPRLPLQHQADLLRLQRQYETAQNRGWLAASRCVRQSLCIRGQWLVNDLQRFVSDTRPGPEEPLATVGDIYRDVLALMPEFKFVHVDRPETTVTAVTHRIVLDEIDLGPFEVVWNWAELGEEQELRVIPQDPNCAGGDEDVCHPHIRDQTLCVGDAQVPLQRAFQAGRLYDAFLIVRQVLQTYNPRSAYIALADWSGCHCLWCGLSLSEGDAWTCETCGEALCEDCHTSCAVCGNALCRRCGELCTDCEATVCRACRPLIGNRRLSVCTTCHEKETPADEDADANEEENVTAADASDDPHAAVHPDGVGQVTAPAGCG